MRIFDGTNYRDATTKEIDEFERAMQEEEERRRLEPPTVEDKAEAYDILMGGAT